MSAIGARLLEKEVADRFDALLRIISRDFAATIPALLRHIRSMSPATARRRFESWQQSVAACTDEVERTAAQHALAMVLGAVGSIHPGLFQSEKGDTPGDLPQRQRGARVSDDPLALARRTHARKTIRAEMAKLLGNLRETISPQVQQLCDVLGVTIDQVEDIVDDAHAWLLDAARRASPPWSVNDADSQAADPTRQDQNREDANREDHAGREDASG